MPLDGLSSANTGMQRFITPNESLLQVDQLVNKQFDQAIKKAEKGEKASSNFDRNSKEDKDDLQGRHFSEDKDNEKDKSLKEYKKYRVKFNPATDMVEFIDQTTGFIIETIAPTDLLKIVSKSITPSGIFVDKKV